MEGICCSDNSFVYILLCRNRDIPVGLFRGRVDAVGLLLRAAILTVDDIAVRLKVDGGDFGRRHCCGGQSMLKGKREYGASLFLTTDEYRLTKEFVDTTRSYLYAERCWHADSQSPPAASDGATSCHECLTLERMP